LFIGRYLAVISLNLLEQGSEFFADYTFDVQRGEFNGMYEFTYSYYMYCNSINQNDCNESGDNMRIIVNKKTLKQYNSYTCSDVKYNPLWKRGSFQVNLASTRLSVILILF
jgi:hypothetical protein